MSTQFSINLVSNASMGFFPQNTMSSFKTQLPTPVELKGDWTVSLSEISFPCQIINVRNGYFLSRSITDKKVARSSVPSGVYTSIDALLTAIARAAYGSTYQKVIQWNIDENSQKLTIILKAKTYLRLTSQNLLDILGFTRENDSIVGPGRTTGLFPIDLYGGKHSMYVYCNLLGNEILGDQNTQLLRVVPLSSLIAKNSKHESSSPTVYFPVTNLQFKRVDKAHFNDIEIKLCDETGSLIPFLGIGRTNITLLFKLKH